MTLHQSFNGRYDFTFIGGPMNPGENSVIGCVINTESQTTLNLAPGNAIESAYLYWAGSGTGDFEVKLNGQDIVSQRNFGLVQSTSQLPFFSAFADVTALVQATGNGTYLLSELDVTNVISPAYCNNQTNFAGWAILIVYQNDALPLNQILVYDGLDYVGQGHEEINIVLEQLNVIDNEGSKIGFIAWEGDSFLAENENLRLNGNILSNAFNPQNNAFNGTHSASGSFNYYNMDLDIYEAENHIAIGDTLAEIQLTSSRDFVMINTIVTKFNSQLPDATISIDQVAVACKSREIIVGYTVYNLNSTDPLPAETPISIYANGIYIGHAMTHSVLEIGQQESAQIALLLPDAMPNDFSLLFVVDDKNGTGMGVVTEILETNNNAVMHVILPIPPPFNIPNDAVSCNLGLGSGIFDFSGYADIIRLDPTNAVAFFENQEDAENNVNQIINTANYTIPTGPKTIFFRIENTECFDVGSFELLTRNCPPTVYNYVSANEDGLNDIFFIDGLRDIFIHFDLAIYNRWGVKIWQGNNTSEDWNGTATKGLRIGGNLVPDGTYYYVLHLNDPDYSSPLTGYLYLNR